MLSRGVDGDAVSSFFFLPILNFVTSFFSAENYVFFRSSFCRMVVTDERLQVRRLLIFFQNFPRGVFKKKCFPRGGNGDAKVVFFLAGSFSRNREVFKTDGLIRQIFIFPDVRMFLKSVLILEVIRRTKLMSIFRCVKVAPKSSFFFEVAMSLLVEFS